MAASLADVLDNIRSLEPLPAVATRVLALAARADVVPAELCVLIRTDAALCTRVLKLSNSAYFGFRREIASLEEAGTRLGVARLSSLVLTACAARWFSGHAGGDRDAAQRTWRRNVANALGARALARLAGAESEADRAYTAGLLQNLGEVVLERHFASARAELDRTHGRGQRALAAERLAFGADHAEVGAGLVERWGLPELLVDTIRWHHDPASARRDPYLCALVHLGEYIALAWEEPDGARSLEGDPALEIAQLEVDQLLALAHSFQAELARAQDLVAIG